MGPEEQDSTAGRLAQGMPTWPCVGAENSAKRHQDGGHAMGRQQSSGQEHLLLSLPGSLLGAKGLVVKGGEAFVPCENL